MLKQLRSWIGWTESRSESPNSSFLLTNPPEQADTEVKMLITDIVRLHHELCSKADLRPCEEIDKLFEELVGICTRSLSQGVSCRIMEILPSLRCICANAECALEAHWAAIISGADENPDEDSVYDRLTQFPYFSNYVDLTRMEMAALHAVDASPIRKIAFIGSGPLPLTSLQLFHTLPGLTSILNIDRDSSAITQSRKLCERLGSRGRGMEFLCSDAALAGKVDLRLFDVVFLAALVGSTQVEKEELLGGVVAGMREGAVLVVRSAHGLRRALYAEFDPCTEVVKRCLNVQVVVHPFNHVVNSVIVGRVRRKSRHGDGENLG